jgi:ribosomal-protein-alanine N-acetyltransferase
MEAYTIEPLAPKHLAAVVALDHLCFGGLWSEDNYLRELSSPNSHFWVIVTGGTIVAIGGFWVILEECHIVVLAVHPQHRRRGLGEQLLKQMLETSRSLGLAWATLEVRASNHAASQLYQKFNFQIAGRRRHYYPDTKEDALVLWLKLT